MKRKITVFFILFVCFLLQTTVFQALALASISPNLLIVVVSSFGFMRGRKEGMYTGIHKYEGIKAKNRPVKGVKDQSCKKAGIHPFFPAAHKAKR